MSNDDEIIRLIKYHKRTAPYNIQPTFLIIILILFQLLLFLTIYSIFSEYVPHFAVFQVLFHCSWFLLVQV